MIMIIMIQIQIPLLPFVQQYTKAKGYYYTIKGDDTHTHTHTNTYYKLNMQQYWWEHMNWKSTINNF